MRAVDELLVAGVGVHRRHQPVLDAERVVEHLDHRHEAVRRAARVGDDLVLRRVEVLWLTPYTNVASAPFARRGDDDQRRAGLEVGGGLGAVGEEAGRLDDDVDAEVAPRQLFGLRTCSTLSSSPSTVMPLFVALMSYGSVPRTESYLRRWAIVVERAEIVDRDEVDVGAALLGRPEEVAADAAEAVDADTNRHVVVPFTECDASDRDSLARRTLARR